MNTKEKTYMMALAALLLIGLSTAWAGYNATATISANSIEKFASVSGSGSLSLSNLKKDVWFSKTVSNVFTISNVNITSIYVVVGVINMAELAGKFSSLELNVTLKQSGAVKNWDVISLSGGISSVLLNVTGTGNSDDYTVDVCVWGRPTATGTVYIKMYCVVEPAGTVGP